ncbi:hypothetical protein [uncultured Chryseobacterium sp.]|uniref:hypothetical protein n=1 Tax=uncultured Chryseobacterium sp. TaxID=259322 RepID=UPI0027DD25B2|nr:hypothetical protein [uncultured Chryseobacterium sp.]
MKLNRIIAIGAVLLSATAYSQVIIGDAIGTATTKTSVLLEFANTSNKGIILPYVRTKPSAPTEGTIILDASTPTAARIKYYNGVTTGTGNSPDGWQDLSGQDGNVTAALANQPTPAQVTEDTNAKAIIGANISSADGVLVLESATKAMVLPTVASTDDVPSPGPGMMVYIKKAGAKRLAVYNGSKWSYWKP